MIRDYKYIRYFVRKIDYQSNVILVLTVLEKIIILPDSFFFCFFFYTRYTNQRDHSI